MTLRGTIGASGAVNENASSRILGIQTIDKLAVINQAPSSLILPYDVTILADNPIGYWRMDDVSSPAIDQIAGNNAAQWNGVIFQEPSLVGSDPDNDAVGTPDPGNGYLKVQNDSVFNFSNGSNDLPFSIEIFMTKENTDIGPLVGKTHIGANSNSNEYLLDVLPDGRIVGRLFDLDWVNIHTVTTVDPVISIDTIYHIIWTYAALVSTGLLYVNGFSVPVIYDTIGTYNTMRQTSVELYFGIRYPGTGLSTFHGSYDEISMYDKVLTPTQVTAHYRASL